MKEKHDRGRRRFLGGLVTTLSAAGLVFRGKARAAQPPRKDSETLYRHTKHVDDYYRTLAD